MFKSRLFGAILGAAIAALSFYASAERLYSPSLMTFVDWDQHTGSDHMSVCKTPSHRPDGQLKYLSSYPHSDHTDAGYYSYICYNGEYVLGYITGTYYCPTDYTRDDAKVWTDPQVCFQDVSDPPPTDVCGPRAGETVTLSLQCGTASCSTGWVEVSGSYSCAGTVSESSSTIPGTINEGSCKATFTSFAGGANPPWYAVPGSGGTTTLSSSCDVIYTLDGTQAAETDTPPPPGSDTPTSGSVVNPVSTGTGGTGGTGTGTGDTGTGTGDTGTGTGDTGTGTGGTGTGGTGTCDPATQTCSAIGSYGGTDDCTVPPACTGDAVMCGIITQNWRDTCRLIKPPTADEKLAFAAEGGDSASAYQTKQAQYSAEISSKFSGWGATQQQGQCPADVSFSAMGHAFVFPLSQYCGFFSIFRFFSLAFAYLAAARIYFKVLGG